MADRAKAIPRPADRLFVESWIYDWGIDFERSVALWWTGIVDEGITLILELLRRDDLPDRIRGVLVANLDFYRNSPPPTA